MAGNLSAISNVAGTRLYTLVADLGFCSVSGKSPGDFHPEITAGLKPSVIADEQ
jgi:hypothetical protein